MLCHKLNVLLLVLISTPCFSQDSIAKDVSDVTKLNFLPPGISHEKRIGKLQTLYSKAFLSTDIYIGYSSALGHTEGIHFRPALALQYRYYYNAEKRNGKGKRTDMNSLNYISAGIGADFYTEAVPYNGERELRVLKSFGFVWGLQRNYPKRFSIDLSCGPGYLIKKERSLVDGEFRNAGEFTVLAQISLGFWINKRN